MNPWKDKLALLKAKNKVYEEQLSMNIFHTKTKKVKSV